MQRTRECQGERRKGEKGPETEIHSTLGTRRGSSSDERAVLVGRPAGKLGPGLGDREKQGRMSPPRVRRVRGEDRDLSKHPIVLSVSRSRVRHVPLFLSFLPGHLSRRSSDSPRRSGTARPPPAMASELQRYSNFSVDGGESNGRDRDRSVGRSDGDVLS